MSLTFDQFDFDNAELHAEAGKTGKADVFPLHAVAVEHMDRDAAKRLVDKINRELPDAKARDAYQANTGGSTVNLRDPDGVFVQISSKDGR